MPFLVMFESNNMFLTSTSDIKLSKKINSAKKWNNPELAHKAINKLMEKGKDINGLMVCSVHKAKVLAPIETEVSDAPKRKRGRPRKNPIPTMEMLDISEKEDYVSVESENEFVEEKVEEVEESKSEVTEAYEYGDLAQDFSGFNKFCLNCTKECKQKFTETIVYCPIFHPKRSL